MTEQLYHEALVDMINFDNIIWFANAHFYSFLNDIADDIFRSRLSSHRNGEGGSRGNGLINKPKELKEEQSNGDGGDVNVEEDNYPDVGFTKDVWCYAQRETTNFLFLAGDLEATFSFVVVILNLVI